MSHFVECQTEFRDPQALVAALVECGFEESQIEIHEQAVPLYGYQGDVRAQKAHEQPDVAAKLSKACQVLKNHILNPDAVSQLTGRLKRRVVLD